MKFLLLLVPLSVVYQLSSEEVIGHYDSKQELLLCRQKLTILYNEIDTKCADYTSSESKRVPGSELEIPIDLAIAKQLYNKLIKQLIECKAKLKSVKSSSGVPQTTTQSSTTSTEPPQYKDCQEFYEHGYRKSGVYEINLPNFSPFDVWCDFFGNHGWTVIQRHDNDGTVSFYRQWAAYKQGFGTKDAEYWLGNDNIHALTTTNRKLNIQLVLKDGSQKSGYWTKFYISDESDNYRLTIDGSGYTGDLMDEFAIKHSTYGHNGMAFSTADRDNDGWSGDNCAARYRDGWWYNYCGDVQLNREDSVGMHWYGYGYPLRSSVMRVTR